MRIFREKWPEELAHLVFNVILRAQNSFRSYEEAHNETEKYLERREEEFPNATRYFQVLSAWENFVLQIWISVRHINELNRKLDPKSRVHEKGDGSPEDYLCGIANAFKHDIESGQRTPIWLSNAGIHSCKHKQFVTYEDAAGVLSNLSGTVDVLIDLQKTKEEYVKRISTFEQ